MDRLKRPFVAALIATALFVLAYAATRLLGSQILFRYRSNNVLSTINTVSLIAAALMGFGLLIAAGIIAVAAALQPASRWRKLLYILPAYFLGFTLVGIVLALLGIGAVGPFISIWLVSGILLTLITAIIAAARMNLGAGPLRAALRTLSIAALPGLMMWLGVIVSIIIVLTTTPSATTGNGPVGEGAREGLNGRTPTVTPLMIGGAFITLFGMIDFLSLTRGMRAARETANETTQAFATNYRLETQRALFSSLALTIVGLAVAQLIPVSHQNPAQQNAIQWDSQQTQTLARRACMDCHSNETTWPWYSYIAPGSWLTASHVSEGRERLNLSALAALSSTERQRTPQEIKNEVDRGEMPPKDYVIIHSEARLNDAEKQQLIQGLQQTIAQTPSQ